MADLFPDEAIALALAAGGISGEPGDLCWEEMLAALEAAAPLILAAELDRLIADPDNYTAGGAFRPIVLVHRCAELREVPETQDGGE